MRKRSALSLIAGVAMQISSSEFVAMMENFGPTGTTKTLPVSLAKKRFRPSETGEAVKPSLPLASRSLYLILPVLESKQVRTPLSVQE